MSAQKPAKVCFAKQNLRKTRILKNRGEVLMIFLLSLYWKAGFSVGKAPKLNEAQLIPLIAFLLANTDRFPGTSPEVELLLVLGAWTIICENKSMADCPLDRARKLVLKT